jgi:hypothetical protein
VRRHVDASRPPSITNEEESDQVQDEGNNHDVLEMRISRRLGCYAGDESSGEGEDARAQV